MNFNNKIFYPDYPSDDIGSYIDVTGIVIDIAEPLSEETAVKVRTHRGIFTGYYPTIFLPKIGYKAVIRIYSFGGGWYPDNRIMSWMVTDDKEEINDDEGVL